MPADTVSPVKPVSLYLTMNDRPLPVPSRNEPGGSMGLSQTAAVLEDTVGAMPRYYCAVKIDFGIMPWMPLVPSTT
jgi:hypothetical protein